MGATFFCIGDCHFRLKRLAEGKAFIDWVIPKARAAETDVIVILGDLLHTFRTTHVEPFGLMTRLVRECAAIAPTYVLIGNHDYPGPSEYQTDNHFMVGIKDLANVSIIDRVQKVVVGKKAYVMMPYLPYGRLYEALGAIKGWKDCGLIFGHQPVRSVDPCAEPWSDGYPTLVSGHIHDHQRPQKNVLYVGSVTQVAVNENPDKYVWVLRDRAEALGVKKIRIPRRGVCQIVTTPANLKTAMDPTIVARHDVQLIVECTAEEKQAFEATKLHAGLSAKKEVSILYRVTRSVIDPSPQTRTKTFEEILSSLVEASGDNAIRAYSLITGRTKTGFIEVPS
jgi:hypothetical protein